MPTIQDVAEEVAQAVEEAGVGPYAAGQLRASLDGLTAGAAYALVIVRQSELYGSDGSRGAVLPASGEIVACNGCGNWQLLVAAAVFGNGRVAMLGVQGGGSVPEWTVYEKPLVMTRVMVPEDPSVASYTSVAAPGALEVWRNEWPGQWEGEMVGLDTGVTIASMAEFERRYGVAVPEPPLPARLWKARERIALFFAPWMGRDD